jgi:type IV secretory pathway VirJ component
MTRRSLRARTVCLLLFFMTALRGSAAATTVERADVPVRGKAIALTIYRPQQPPSKFKGTVFMGSGDVGWVGLAVSMAEFLSDAGYLVVGINVRQYLSAFTGRTRHLMPADVPADYAEIAAYLKGRHLLQEPVIVSGVSEGAALAVLGASSKANHTWISGVITMGLPATAELAWRWTDFPSWITKKDADEPSFAPKDFIASVSPLPLWMIQSTKDEYVTEAAYRELEQTARHPKQLVLIDANNHRFTDRMKNLRDEYFAALAGIRAKTVPSP